MTESLRLRRVRSGVPALPPRPAADGTRGRILLAGLGLFAEHGYHGTSIRDIAAEAAVRSASLYAHFPSKEAILAELVLAGHEEHHARLVTALLHSGTDPRDRLAALVRAHVRAHTDYPMLAVVANNEMHALSPPAAAPAAAVRRRSEALLRRSWPSASSKACSNLVHLRGDRRRDRQHRHPGRQLVPGARGRPQPLPAGGRVRLPGPAHDRSKATVTRAAPPGHPAAADRAQLVALATRASADDTPAAAEPRSGPADLRRQRPAGLGRS